VVTEIVRRLADIYESLEDDTITFEDTVQQVVGEDAQALYWYHPNLEAFLPVIVQNEDKLVWDLADELAERWALRLSR